MSTRKTLRQLLCPILGGVTGDITSGGATTFVSNDLLGAYHDDHFQDWKSIFPDAANVGDTNRVLTDWAGSTGTGTWVGNRTDTTYTSETFELYPPSGFSLLEINDALDASVQETRHTIKLIIPTMDGVRDYHLSRQSWIRFPNDVDGVMVRESPNLLANSDFNVWESGSALAPSLWALSGSGATVARSGVTSSLTNTEEYAAALTRVGTDCQLAHAILSDWVRRYFEGSTVTVGCWVHTTAASRARVRVYDGTDTSNSGYHSGGSSLEWLTVSHTVNAAQNTLQAILRIETGDVVGTFSNPVFVEGSTIPNDLRDHGDSNYREYIPGYRNIGNAIHLDRPLPRGQQIIVWSAQNYPAFTSDTFNTDCPDAVVIYKTLLKLKRYAKDRPGVNVTKMQDAINEYKPSAEYLISQLRQKPTLAQRNPVVVTGA